MNEFNLQLRKKRQLGDIITDSFALIKYYFKPILRVFLLYILPFVILTGYCYGYFMQGFTAKFTDNPVEALTSINPLVLILFLLGSMMTYGLLYTAIFGVMSLHEKGTNDLDDGDYLSGFVWSNFIKVIGAFLFMYMILILPILLAGLASIISPVLSGILIFILVFVLLYYAIPFSFIPFSSVIENSGYSEALTKAIRLSSGNWWSTFGILLVAGIIGYFLSFVFTLPMQMMTSFGQLSDIDSESISQTTGIKYGLAGILAFIGNSASSIFVGFCLCLKYFDLVERNDGSGLAQRIDNLGDSDQKFYENEGEY